jgi:Tfp pilus assembly protein PilF
MYATFEQAVTKYRAHNWKEASVLFQECIQQDPYWSAAYQYLALVFHAQGLDDDAAWAADQALQHDPDNTQLAAWATQLRATLTLKQPPAA